MLISNSRPCYRILNERGYYGPNDHLYPEGSIIYLDDEPNDQMSPLNEPAVERMAAYLARLNAGAQEAAKAKGMLVAQRPVPTLEDLGIDRQRVALVQGGEGMAVMGRKATGPARVEQIVEDEEPAAVQNGRPVKRNAVVADVRRT